MAESNDTESVLGGKLELLSRDRDDYGTHQAEGLLHAPLLPLLLETVLVMDIGTQNE